jgi:hypothetical protein
MTPWAFDVKFPCDTQFTIEPLTFAVGDDKNLKMLPQGQHQSALRRYMYKLHVSRPSHLLQAVPVQVWILIQDIISALSSLFRVFRSCRLSYSHRARPCWQRPPIKTQIMITSRSGEVPVGILSKRTASSSWWPRLEGLRRIALADIP